MITYQSGGQSVCNSVFIWHKVCAVSGASGELGSRKIIETMRGIMAVSTQEEEKGGKNTQGKTFSTTSEMLFQMWVFAHI